MMAARRHDATAPPPSAGRHMTPLRVGRLAGFFVLLLGAALQGRATCCPFSIHKTKKTYIDVLFWSRCSGGCGAPTCAATR